MISSLYFIVCFLILTIEIFLFPKQEKKVNPIIWLVISFIISLILNSIIVFFFSIVHIPCYLFWRSTIMLFIIFSLSFYFYKRKTIQSFTKVNLWEILTNILIIVFIVIIANIRFGTNVELNFETTDPAVHFLSGERFSESNLLLEDSPSDVVYGGSSLDRSMFFSYVSLGTIFEISHNFGMNKIIDAKIFIIFECCILYLIILFFYYNISNFKKNKLLSSIEIFIINTIIIFLMAYGYPLNSLIFGYHYLGIFLFVAEIIIYLFKNYDNYLNKSFLLLSSLLLFTVFSTYYMFVPVIYGGIGVYYLYICFASKKYCFKDIIKITFFTLIIPFSIGMYYYFFSKLFIISNTDSSAINAFKCEGYIYRNLIGNFIILIPLLIINFIDEIRQKRLSLVNILLLFQSIFIIILFYCFYKGYIASYYYYKNYYLLWIISFIILGRIINDSDSKNRKAAFIILLSLSIVFTIYKTNFESKLTQKNILLNPTSFSAGLTDIYWFNDDRITKNINKPIFTVSELNDLNDLLNESSLNGNIYYYTPDLFKRLWYYDLFGKTYTPYFTSLNDFYIDLPSANNVLCDKNISYIIVDIDYYNALTFIKSNVVTKNDNYIVLKV